MFFLATLNLFHIRANLKRSNLGLANIPDAAASAEPVAREKSWSAATPDARPYRESRRMAGDQVTVASIFSRRLCPATVAKGGLDRLMLGVEFSDTRSSK